MVAVLKNFEFQLLTVEDPSFFSDQKYAIMQIKDIHPHFLNDEIDWVLLKECQDQLNVNECPEIKNCWKTRDHRKLIR